MTKRNIIQRNNVKVIGQGEQTILFAHGFGCDQKMWQYIAPTFAENYQVVLFDYVGAGYSDITAYDSEKYGTLHGYAQDILDIIEEMHLQQVILIGHSISSTIGYIMQFKNQYFKTIIMIGPSSCYLNDESSGYIGGFEKSDVDALLNMMEMNFAGWASFMVPIASNQANSIELTQQLENSFASINPRIAREFAEVTFFSDCRSILPRVKVPTLIIQCSNDSIVPIKAGEYLHKHLPNSTFEIIDTRGHYPHISEPVETIKIITKYLTSLNSTTKEA